MQKGENRPSQDGKAGETNGNFSTGCSNNIIDTDESPVEPTPWSCTLKTRLTLEKVVKSKGTGQTSIALQKCRSGTGLAKRFESTNGLYVL